MVFWLALLFASFGPFAPPNFTSTVTLTLCSLVVAGAVAISVELEQALEALSASHRSRCAKRSEPCRPNRATKMHLSHATSFWPPSWQLLNPCQRAVRLAVLLSKRISQ